ncbi:MAG TPA: hypothetical protein PLT75_14425, partial [Spirochaetota bacterium]|nr:hypothetical protein [Spirochaetota bacterium]
GVYIWPNGDKYTGQWKEGVMDGKGVYRYSNGTELRGVFENNSFVRREEAAAAPKAETNEAGAGTGAAGAGTETQGN